MRVDVSSQACYMMRHADSLRLRTSSQAGSASAAGLASLQSSYIAVATDANSQHSDVLDPATSLHSMTAGLRSSSLPAAANNQQSRSDKTLVESGNTPDDNGDGLAATTRDARSSSAPASMPSVPLQQYEFVVASDQSTQVKWPSKHEGVAVLKRIFIGPSYIGQNTSSGSTRASTSASVKGKQRMAALSQALDGNYHQYRYNDGEQTSSDSDSGSDEHDQDGNRVKQRDRLRHAQVTRKQQQQRSRLPTGETVRGNSRKSSDHKWQGGSFEIGGEVRDAMARRRQRQRSRSSASSRADETTKSTVEKHAAPTFVTARTHQPLSPTAAARYEPRQPPPEVESNLPPDLAHKLLRRLSDPLISDTASLSAAPVGDQLSPPPSQAAPLSTRSKHHHPAELGNGFPPPQQPSHAGQGSSIKSVPVLPRPIIGNKASASRINGVAGGATTSRKATVTFSNAHLEGDLPPAPPTEVLARPVPDTMVPDDIDIPPPRPPRRRDDVLAQERMLCRVDWTAREDLPDFFDEHNARKFPTRHEGFEEFGVVLRRNRVELWTEYRNPALGTVWGKKKLKHVIPLNKRQTRLSLYSSVDSIFCLTHRASVTNAVAAPKSTATTAKKSTPGPRGKHDSESSDSDDGKHTLWWHRSKTQASKRAYVHFRHSGTSVYLFKSKTASISKQWVWNMYLKLGGQMPSSLELSVPVLGAKLKFPIPTDLPLKVDDKYLWPDEREGQGWKLLKPSKVIDFCMQRLLSIPDFRDVCEQHLRGETTPVALAWRRGKFLDWVKTGPDEDDWGTVCGLAHRQMHPEPVLELRLALHASTTVRVPSTTRNGPTIRLSEPPSVEGFLIRFRKNQVNERVYVSSHDGFLFICRPSSAHAPEPPTPVVEGTDNPAVLVLAPFVAGFASLGKEQRKKDKVLERIGVSRIGGGTGIRDKRKKDRALNLIENQRRTGHDDDDQDWGNEDLVAVFEHGEKLRLYKQICDARGYIDLRDVDSVEPDLDEEGQRSAAMTPDLGGVQGMSTAADKSLLARQRSFLLKRKDGQAVRFECHSIAVREEWVGRLKALVAFWTRRQITTAREQMELIGPILRKPHPDSTHTDPRDRDDDQDPDPMLLTRVYNFCIKDGCRPVLLSGRFFIKKGLRGMFKERFLILLPGTLIEYQVAARDMFGTPLPNAYHRRKRVISLRGCYVYSGRLTTHLLSPHNSSTWDPADAQEKFPRIYPQDRLRVTDDEEDCTLALFKRPFGGGGRFGKAGKTTVLRARSMIERDQWVFALNEAIEQLGDAEYERETRLKEFPWLKR
ncbi:hypothetical protein OIO90_002453 [Microbotryomycetes sp. JL221]|nr:hypothetical protein OIO90_002453 [Microbotryomycetes sp. JL221]